MPCSTCEKKLIKLSTPNVGEGHLREVGINKLLEKKKLKEKFLPGGAKCTNCKNLLHVKGTLCPTCAYSQGRCNLCGKKIFDTSKHCMTLV